MTGQVVAEVAGREITEEDVVSRLKIGGAWFGALAELSNEALVRQAAEQEGLSVSDDELQKAFDDFRLSRGLHKADETHRWLTDEGLTVDEVESMLEAGILSQKLAEEVISDDAIDSLYEQNPREFEYAQISHIVVRQQGAAEELALSVREEGEDFANLARKHSIDQATRSGGGFVGLVTRSDTAGIPDDVADRIFAAAAGDVIGPFPLGENRGLVRAEEVGRRPLDDGLRAALRAQLFGGWLAQRAAG
ncbi:MAG: peptidyl-prolyl cis-trans isomerase [Pirellulales bacterium]